MYIPCERVISNLMPHVVFDRMVDPKEVPEYTRKEMNALKKTLAEQGASFKDDARAKILEQLDRLEKALSRDEAQEDVDEQAQPTA